MKNQYRQISIVVLSAVAYWVLPANAQVETVALWLFDEPAGLYPSCALDDESASDYPMVLGPGGRIVAGKFGNALEAKSQPEIEYPENAGQVKFGLSAIPPAEGRRVEPMTWANAGFCGLITLGEKHLRNEIGFPDVTGTRLNLGPFDWTVEFWFRPDAGEAAGRGEGVVFEIGEGPRGENDHVTRLILHASGESFSLENQPAGVVLEIPTDKAALNAEVPAWHHFAFTYVAGRKRLQHYVDGVAQKAPKRVKLAALEAGDEAYLSVGRDGVWGRPLPGLLDELRFSSGLVYSADFQPPGTFSSTGAKAASGSSLASGPRLLFGGGVRSRGPVDLGSRKHLFIDDALVSVSSDVTFRVNPATRIEPVMENIQGPLRKHVTVIEDDDGLIRLYAGRHNNHLGVWISRDGVNWEAPDLGREDASGERNIVIHESVAVGSVFIDPNAPPQERWKYISGYHDRGVYLYVSSDGWSFKRYRTAVLPFRSGSQSITYYDDQRQRYVGFHRSDFGATPVGKTERSTVRTEVRDLTPPWPFEPVSPERYEEVGKTRRIKDFQPWYLDNGPLTPGGFGIEYPLGFGPEDSIDSPGTDIYVPKIVKYPWAPDVYLNFALVYFHYWGDGPETRQELGREERGRGSGPIETQLAVSRDGVHWQRYGRPAYIGVGRVGDYDIHQTYTADGMVRRGDEIWQYVYGQEEYHSRWIKTGTRDAFFRVVQRLDGFVSADTPYEREGVLITRPFTFTGNRLLLNIDTDAAGYAQVGFIGEDGRPVAGYSVDDCIYINGDYIENEVEWMKSGKDLSSLVGTRVSLVFRMRGCKLYAMQFADR